MPQIRQKANDRFESTDKIGYGWWLGYPRAKHFINWDVSMVS